MTKVKMGKVVKDLSPRIADAIIAKGLGVLVDGKDKRDDEKQKKADAGKKIRKDLKGLKSKS